MRYLQVKGGQKLHLVYEAGEGIDAQHLIPAGKISALFLSDEFDLLCGG